MPDDPESNPFHAPPTDDDAAPPRLPWREFSALAVVAGVIVDWGLTKALVPRYLDWVIDTHGMSGIDDLNTPGTTLRFVWSSLGWGFSVVGGIVTGWLARRRELFHGLGNFLLTSILLRLDGYRQGIPLEINEDFLRVHSGNLFSILLGAGLVWLARWLLALRERP